MTSSDPQDQRSELDDWLVVLRKVQKPSPDGSCIAQAQDVSKRIQAMINKGVAMEAHLQIREQLEDRLAELRSNSYCEPKGEKRRYGIGSRSMAASSAPCSRFPACGRTTRGR